MADEEIEKPETPEESSTSETGGEEPKVPLSRLRQKDDEITKLKKQLESSGQEQKPPVDEGRQQEKAKLRETLEEIEAEKKQEEQKALEELNQKIGELKVIDPTLDEKALLDIIEKYGVDTDNAFKIYNDLSKGQVPVIKPKLPTATKTTDDVKDDLYKPKEGGSLWDAAQEGLKKFGLK